MAPKIFKDACPPAGSSIARRDGLLEPARWRGRRVLLQGSVVGDEFLDRDGLGDLVQRALAPSIAGAGLGNARVHEVAADRRRIALAPGRLRLRRLVPASGVVGAALVAVVTTARPH